MNAGFQVTLLDLSKLMCAPATRTLGDVVACSVMGLPCRGDGHFDWPAPGPPATFVTRFDDFKHHVALVTPHMLRNAGCTPPSNERAPGLALLHSDLLAAGAVQRCSDWRGLEALLLAFDAPFLARHRASVVPRDAPPCPQHIPARQYCELALESAATWDAMRQVAQMRGFVCKVAANAPGRGGQQHANPRIATTSDVSPSAFQPRVVSSSHPRAIAVVLTACMASTSPCGALNKGGQFHIRQRYAKSVYAWATFSSLPVVFVERSGANISYLQQLPSMKRRGSFEFLSPRLVAPDRSERFGRATDAPDVTVALSVVHALEHSWLLRHAVPGDDDLIFLTAAHHYVAGLQDAVRAACWSSNVLRSARPWPSLAVHTSGWRRSSLLWRSHDRPSVIGFTRRRAHDLFGWSELPWASRFGCLACHVSHVVKEARDHWDGQDVCELRDLIRNSSLSVAKHKRAELPRDIEDAGTTSFFDGRWMCFAHHVQDGKCVANLPEAFCSSNSNLSLAECVRMCDDTPECQMVVHNQPSHSDDNARGCWLKAELKMMRRDRASFNTHTCVQVSKRRSDPPHVLKQTPRSFCTGLVVPVDVSPVRSPQAVHDVLASELASARSAVLEIGARNGDSIHCFARFARAASVIEANPSYCRVLEERAHRLRQQNQPDFAVECGYFPQACLTQPLLCSHVNVFTFWVGGGQRQSSIFARDEEAPLLSSELMFELAKLHARGRTLRRATVVVFMDLSMRGHMHDLRAVARRGWADWMAFVPYNEQSQCLLAARRGDGGGVSRYGGKAVCDRAMGAFMAVAIPLDRMVQEGRPLRLHEPARGFTFRLLGLGCCRLAPGHEKSEWRATSLGPMFASSCATACEMDSKCTAFELVELRRDCRITRTRKPRHTCAARCWLFFTVVGLPLSTNCDQETGRQVCYAKELPPSNASSSATPQAVPEERRSRSTPGALMVEGGPRSLEPRLALDENSSAVLDVAAVVKGAPCSSGDSKTWPKGSKTWPKGRPAIGRRIARVYVVLSACINVFLDISNTSWMQHASKRVHNQQQTSASTRLAIYERSVAHWAMNTSTPIVLVENSGADLAPLRRHVPAWRQQTFEFLSVPKPLAEDIGRAEAATVLSALQHSRLLADLDDSDLIFLVTARYAFLHDFESTVRLSCGLLPMLVLQNPPWIPASGGRTVRQETSILGFKRQLASHLFGWALPSASQAHLQRFIDKAGASECLECHATRTRRQFELTAAPGCMCKLPAMTLLFPVVEGSTSILRTAI